MKLTRSKNIIIMSTIAGILAFSFGISPASADEAAERTTTQTDSAAGATVSGQPLLPGDFFNFVKMIYEGVQLAIETDDADKAILLAQSAQERLAESAALLKLGKVDTSERALQHSLVLQQQAIDTAASVIETEDTASEHAARAKKSQAVASTEQTNETKRNSSIDDEKEAYEPEQIEKAKSTLQHNIVALAAALDKVKNPQAQRSLLKNMMKSFSHLEKKLEKRNVETDEQASQPAAKTAAANTNTVTAKQNRSVEPEDATAPADLDETPHVQYHTEKAESAKEKQAAGSKKQHKWKNDHSNKKAASQHNGK